MLKLLLCLLSVFVLAVLVLQLRQQQLDLNYQTNLIHNRIEQHKGRLWNQQIQIAAYTAPNALSKVIESHALDLVPQKPLRP